MKSGKILAWGWNTSGQTNVPAAAESGVTAIDGGDYHTVALKGGQVLAWGYNGAVHTPCSQPRRAE